MHSSLSMVSVSAWWDSSSENLTYTSDHRKTTVAAIVVSKRKFVAKLYRFFLDRGFVAHDQSISPMQSSKNPHSISRDNNPYSISRDNNPHSISRDNNPYSISRYNNPYSISRDNNPYPISRDKTRPPFTCVMTPVCLFVKLTVTVSDSTILWCGHLLMKSSSYLRIHG